MCLLESVSRRGFSCLGIWLSRVLYVLSWLCFEFPYVSSCLMSYDCVLTVSLSGIAYPVLKHRHFLLKVGH